MTCRPRGRGRPSRTTPTRDEDHPRDRDAEPHDRAAQDRQRSAERRYATVNPFTGETEQEFPFTETAEIDGIIERAHAAYLEWRDRPVEERAAVVRRAAELMRRAAATSFAALITTRDGQAHARRPPASCSSLA